MQITAEVVPPPDDLAELEQKKKELAEAKADLADASTKAAALSTEIKALEGRIADLKKATDAYTATAQALQKELDDDSKVIGHKLAMALAAVKDQKVAIESAIKSVEDDIKKKAGDADTLKTAAKNAWTASEAADAEAASKLESYSTLKLAQKSAGDQLKEIKAFIDQAAKAETLDDVVAMYFLLTEASSAAKKVVIMPAADYAKAAKAAQTNVETTKTIAAEKKAALVQANKDYADSSKTASAAAAGRRNTILTKLKQIKVEIV